MTKGPGASGERVRGAPREPNSETRSDSLGRKAGALAGGRRSESKRRSPYPGGVGRGSGNVGWAVFPTQVETICLRTRGLEPLR